MSQQLRHLKTRIRSIEGTWKVTRAMEMVAMAKFKSMQAPLTRARVYVQKLASILAHVVGSSEEGLSHPLLAKTPVVQAVGLLVITSDAGLCGGYNDTLIKAANKFIKAMPGREVRLYVLGRKATNFFKKRELQPVKVFPGFHGKLKADIHVPIADFLFEEFSAGKVGELHVAYTVFENAMKHKPVVEKFAPLDVAPVSGEQFMVEAGEAGIINDLLPIFVSSRLRQMLMESLASEYSARMVAMKGAKDNAKELMGDLVLQRNKMRQATITKEIIEIISSVEALKG
ncbi:MAG: ATP synthase F1 subunit gamma [Candidatus Omnitrophica bacterium]|nr:ATP synthase F1 subunit gamma [Candidatus Omnitrophota bacterium]